MLNLRDRTEFIITHIVNNSVTTKKNIADETGLTDETISAYQKKRVDPKAEFIIKFCKKYNVNVTWFMTGEGVPFPGADRVYPHLFKVSDQVVHITSEPEDVYNTDQLSMQIDRQDAADPFAQDVSYLKEIYDYQDTGIIEAIHQNLKTFVRTVRREKLVSIQNKKIADLESRLEQLEQKLLNTGRGKEDQKIANSGVGG